ncbi:putative transcriptional regulator of viral defense system [Breznakia sp. PF5-3]|uniref:type IV toxin-antitoxin system AbiEi family antitoxin domain-containing protein n=1 Tax=unclassified Breznakia TaxID=2623764 RepID=UPI0024050E6D|nr:MULTISPECIES: type IV toxin-antitoxin system AbiEi family antitoxin domain-containing protein [unclassified Breznakia]MDF9824015.1 putative transcriptional regulator of viral defense system [Breznakia sp. PM6-1]MDF9834814.1 putative transcriptional regulator of viral defense system [Breznakia sp. PF5-3]MDF9838133.1 putative transcriptional regulator of viral defense system [Breznakia sp. PFB2-8]MDF9860119.1 putative transcriptional regulator of viral defense system [Breznakia sp. PH5-24]
MSKKENSLDINQDFITFSQVKEEGVPYSVIRKKLDSGELEKAGRGIYRKPDVYVDESYTLQYRYPKGVYSLETALWLHGLSLTVPFEPTMSFPYGTNTKLIKEAGIKPIILRSNYEEGIVEVRTPGGQIVRVYEIERTLTESLRGVYKMDVQIIAPAFKMYASKGKINFSKLLKYAKMFKVEKKVQSYLEVLLVEGLHM